MSEPTQLQMKEIVNIFLTAYNTANHSKYHWDDNKSCVAKTSSKRWIDAIVYDDQGKELHLQHKEIIWVIEYDKIRNGTSDKIVKKLIESLSSRGLSDIVVHLNFYQKKLISYDKDIDEFCFWVTELINSKLGEGYPKSYHLFLLPKTLQGYWTRTVSTLAVFLKGVRDAFYIAIDKPTKVKQHIYGYDINDEIYLKKIKAITSYITIFRNPTQKKPVVGWGYSELEPRPLPYFGDVIVSEIRKNVDSRYENTIVLLDCNRPVDTIDYELVQDQISQLNYSAEIWLIENFVNNINARQIYKKS